jgi:hypothetical protein
MIADSNSASSARAIPRALHPSHSGYLSPVSTDRTDDNNRKGGNGFRDKATDAAASAGTHLADLLDSRHADV